MSSERKTILIVDDDEDYLLQQRVQFTARGYNVITADSAAAASQALEGRRPDCAVVDLMMEKMDSGLVLAHRMKKQWPDLPVILCTAVTAETGIEFTATRSPWIKADAVLHKPVRFEQLLREVERLA